MKRRTIFQALLASAFSFTFLLAGCTTVDTRIQERPEAFRRMSPSDQALVQQGRIREGMSRDAVYIAWGPPSQRAEGRMRGSAIETWIYFDTSVGDYQGPFGYGGYGGGYGGYGGGYGGFGYGYGFGGGFGYSGHRRHGRFGGFYYDPFFDPYFYNRVSVLRYPERTVSFQRGRVIAYQLLPRPYLP
jgi:hypothetical protein